jgi:FkbM family methyltransferase
MKLVHKYINMQPRFRETLMKVIYGKKDVDVLLFQHPIRINSLLENGYYRASRISSTNSLLRDELGVFHRINLFLRGGMTFVDAGGNVGLFSSSVADVAKLYRDFKVVAFEANPDTFARLSVNAERYGFKAINIALGAAEGEADFVLGAVSGIAATAENTTVAHIAGRGFKVQIRRLDSYEFDGDIFLKIDVEGQELEVLKGATKLFEAGRVVAAYVDGFGNPEVPELLRSFGMKLYDPVTLDPWTEDDYTLLAVRN